MESANNMKSGDSSAGHYWRTSSGSDKAASKATPGFDVMDYGQETYEFGSSTQDARHFDKYVLKVLQEDAEILSELFNSEEK